MDKAVLIEEYKIVIGMINETRAKAKLILHRIDGGEEVSENEVKKVEEDTVKYLTRLAELKVRDSLSCA